jgi:UDP-4-amino-4,6-dideoxy-L-N-acetyl-beta-L-altrosamine transaminase
MHGIGLFNLESEVIDTSSFSHILHDSGVEEFENEIAEFVGAKYACGVSSATNAIFLTFQDNDQLVKIPTMVPPVVANALVTSGNSIDFYDDPNWVGDSYVLHDFGNYKVIDSAQKIERNQFKKEANPQDLMIFSFYPTKPIGSIDGGMIVSDDKDKIQWFKEAVLNGMSYAKNNWERTLKFPGWKMYLNSVQALIGRRNLQRIESKYERLSEIREKYNSEFGIKNTSNHLYRVKVENNSEVMKVLGSRGIVSGVHYKCLHLSDVYKRNYSLPESELLENKILSIPFHEKLSNSDLETVVKNVSSFLVL